MFYKISCLLWAVLSMHCAVLNAQSVVVETQNGATVSQNLEAVRSITFPNHNMVVNKEDAGTNTYSLVTLKKVYFSPVSAVQENNAASPSLNPEPNPAADFIRIPELPEGATPIAIFSAQGVKVLETTIYSPNDRIQIQTLQPGCYFIRVNGQAAKFVKL